MSIALRWVIEDDLAILIPSTRKTLESFSGEKNVIEFASSSNSFDESNNILNNLGVLLYLESKLSESVA